MSRLYLLPLDRLGAQKFGRATTDNVGKRLAIVLDGEIVSAPNINEPITSGNGMISGNFTFQEATDLALLLKIRIITNSFRQLLKREQLDQI